jgi:hypothetical protein
MPIPILLILFATGLVVYPSHDNSGHGACMDHSTSAGTGDLDHSYPADHLSEADQ